MSEFSQSVLVPFSRRQIWSGARWMIHAFGLVFLMLATTSCGRWADLKPDVYMTTSAEKFFTEERAYYKQSSAPPRYCLALSGGGVRAAAYSIGVLKGLHERGELSNLDIISAVSGGSYAATWLYAEKARLKTSGSDKDFLSPDSIREVARKAQLFGIEQAVVVAVIVAQSHEMGLPLTGLDWIFGLVKYTGGLIWSYLPPMSEDHETPTGAYYEAILGKAFHWNNLSIRSASKEPPYLIVNTTLPDADKSGSLANRVFEFTSHGMGSPSVGYSSWAELTPENRADTYSYSRIASISGAAVDKSTTNIKGFKYVNVLGRDLGLGYAMLAPTYAGGKPKQFFVLTDGGDSENLGVYGLIQRKCEEIVVVDAEYDGEITIWNEIFYGKTEPGYQDGYQFGSYQKLKGKLSDEDTTLMIEKLSLNSLENQTAKSKTNANSEPWNCWNKHINTNRTLFDCSEPIITGHALHCKDNACEPDMHVTYLKLSANRSLLDKSVSDANTEAESNAKAEAEAQEVYGSGITKFYEAQKKKGTSEYRDFPHYSTFTLNMDENAFLAIAELGCRAVMRDYHRKHAAKVLRQSETACALIDVKKMAGDTK